MLQKYTFILSLFLLVSAFGLNAAAQTLNDETVAAADSKLAAISLPSGARRVKNARVPQEIKSTLAKIVASGGDKVRQGDSEVVIWGGNYAKSNGSQMIKNLETTLKNSGWEYEIGAKQSDFVLFSLFRAEPQRRVVLGFFVPSEDAFVFALTEMLRADSVSAIAKSENRGEEKIGGILNTGKINSSDSSLIGKWYRGTGSGYVDPTGKTQYKAGESYYFEFFPNGTVEYTREKDVLSIMQCKIKGLDKARGQYTINGDSMTINLGAMNSVGTDSCDAKGNFTKTEPASSISKKFQIKKMDSLFRPDKPTILCFDGQEGDGCFERTNK